MQIELEENVLANMFGACIAACSIIPAFFLSSKKGQLKDLLECQQFPIKTKISGYNVEVQPGYYWMRGPLNSRNPMQININEGNCKIEHSLAIMRYKVHRIIETLKTSKITTVDENATAKNNERKEGEAPNKAMITKDEKHSKWIKSEELMHESPVRYALPFTINGVNINQFVDLFELQSINEIFSQSADLTSKGNSSQSSNMNINVSVNVGGSGGNDQNFGESDRRTIGYKHEWFGISEGELITIIGDWDGKQFCLSTSKTNKASKLTFMQIVEETENVILWLQCLFICMLIGGGSIGAYQKWGEQ